MKKTALLLIVCCFLCACSGNYKLRVNNSSVVSAETVDKDLYYVDKTGEGHDFNLVKHESINKSFSQIQIPVVYTEKEVSIPTKIPEVLKKNLNEEIISFPVSCNGSCKITKNQLTIDWEHRKVYDVNQCSGQEVMFVLWPLWPFTIPYYISECTGTLLNASSTMNLVNSASYLNEKELGVNVGVMIKPEQIFLNCKKKKCELQDAQGKPVNKIYIHKELKIDQKRINELLLEEKKEKERQAKEEAERKRQQRILEAKQKKECPGLYQMLLYIQRYGTTVPEVAIKTSRRFEELGCGYYIQQQMSSYYY